MDDYWDEEFDQSYNYDDEDDVPYQDEEERWNYIYNDDDDL